jgi:hypothetical protein
MTALIATLRPDGFFTRERVAVVVLVLVVWNALCVLQYRFGRIDREGDLTARQMTSDRLLMPYTLLKRALGN